MASELISRLLDIIIYIYGKVYYPRMYIPVAKRDANAKVIANTGKEKSPS